MTPPNVLFVVLDTVRTDRVSSYGYDRRTTPNFDEFVTDATVFTDAVSQASWSIPAHASLFTGTYPTDHGATAIAPILQDSETLPSVLREAGYETYGVSPNEYVRHLTGFGHGFDEFYPDPHRTVPAWLVDLVEPVVNTGAKTPQVRLPIERRFNAARARAPWSTGETPVTPDHQVARVTDILARAEEPFFLFVNVLDAHLPRSPAPEHFDTFVDDALMDVPVVENERAHTFGEGMTETELRKMSQLYDADLRTMDDKLGELLAVFERADLLDDSLVILVSDHGEHLGEFGMVGHQASVFEEVVHVPLAIRFPDGGPASVGAQVETRRVFETVLDVTGVADHPTRSLASGVADDVARGMFVSPMLDLERLLWKREVRYDPACMGETLAFERRGDLKRISVGETAWFFDCPESSGAAISREAPPRFQPGEGGAASNPEGY